MLAGPIVWLALAWLVESTAIERLVAGHWPAWTLLAQAVVMYPVIEEYAFRGAIQPFLLDQQWGRFYLGGVSSANILTSVIFAAAHLLSQAPIWAAVIVFPSLLFGYFRERHNRLASCIVLHSWYNLGFVILVMDWQ